MYPVINIFGLKIITFPIILMIGFFVCVVICITSKKYDNNYIPEVIVSFVYCIIGAIIGGKLLFLLLSICQGEKNIINMLSGFVFYGGLIGGLVGLYVGCRVKNRHFLDLIDVYASVLPLGQAIGRIGCYCNGCCYGKEYDGCFAVNYIVDGLSVSVFPTWFVESLFCFLLFLVLFMISKPILSGMYASVYLILYSFFRFWIEFYRGDTIRGLLFGVSTSQYLSILMLILGTLLLCQTLKSKNVNHILIGREINENGYVTRSI